MADFAYPTGARWSGFRSHVAHLVDYNAKESSIFQKSYKTGSTSIRVCLEVQISVEVLHNNILQA